MQEYTVIIPNVLTTFCNQCNIWNN